MDTIELHKFHRKSTSTQKDSGSSGNVLKKYWKNFWFVISGKKAIQAQPETFYEFIVNDRPLSTVLTEFCKLDNTLLDKSVGALGSFSNKQAELNLIKRLLSEPLTKQDIINMFPGNMDKVRLDHEIVRYMEVLADERIMIYCCAECGDYECGGYTVKVEKNKDSIIWTYGAEGLLQFHFDRSQYTKTFKTYRENI